MDAIMEFFKKEKELTQKANENLPKVLAVKRFKFYKAIGKRNLLDVNDSEVNYSDENLSLVVSNLLWESNNHYRLFDDSVIFDMFNQFKCPQFNLYEYLNAVKYFYCSWLGSHTDVVNFRFHNTIMYLLAHSRDFNEPSKPLYAFSEGGIKSIDDNISQERASDDNLPGNTKYMKNLKKLIADLLLEYDEQKYQQLNLNVTYLALLLTRRVVKTHEEFKKALLSKKTHENFTNLCPSPLDTKLPDLSEKNKLFFDIGKPVSLISLILYGYLNSKGKTRTIFRQTCINHMEFNGIGLAKLFYEVAKLYGIDDFKLWDVMSNYKDCCRSLFILSDLAHMQREMTEADPPKTYKLFPFCRLLSQQYHSNLACKHNDNFYACYALSVLVDMKVGMDKSFARKAHWTKSQSPICINKGEMIARKIYDKINTI